MSISLNYNNDFSRVQITLSGLGSVSAVRIERSTNQLFWQIVRGGVAKPVSSGSAALDDFEFAANQQNFYRVLNADTGAVLETGNITPSLIGKIWLKSIKYPFLNRPLKFLDRAQEVSRESRTEVHVVSGRSLPSAVTERTGSPEFDHSIMTEGANHLAAARDIDLILATGSTFLIHVPDGVRAPGGYVVLKGIRQERLYHGSDNSPHVFNITCQVVAPPGPDIVGTTLTWGTVFSLYGGWNALINANPTWKIALENVGSPDDLVVL